MPMFQSKTQFQVQRLLDRRLQQAQSFRWTRTILQSRVLKIQMQVIKNQR